MKAHRHGKTISGLGGRCLGLAYILVLVLAVMSIVVVNKPRHGRYDGSASVHIGQSDWSSRGSKA